MDVLTEENKDKLSTYHQIGLQYVHTTITELSSMYNLQAGNVYIENDNRPNKKFYTMQGIASNLLFCCTVVERQMEINNQATKEINGLKAKFYDLHKTIDKKNEEIKRLNKQIANLKKNIEL